MSQYDTQATSILLPSSSVAVYTRDPQTLSAAKNLEQDWRFARVGLYVHEGTVQSAFENYKDTTSPSLVIIQTDTIDTAFTEQLAELANYCDAGTSAIVIGPDNDVNLYRRLIDMGVSDYLVKPVDTHVLAEIIAKALIEKIGVTSSRLIAFVGSKGGVGVSAIAQAAACCTSEILGQKTILMDIAGGCSTLGVGLGFEPSATLAQAVRAAESDDEAALSRMLFKASEKLSVLATGIDMMLEASPSSEQVETLIDMLMVRYPVLVVDLSQASEILQKMVLNRAHKIFMLTTPTLSALRHARSLMQEIKDIRGGDTEAVDLFVNMQGLVSGYEVSTEDIQTALEKNPAAIIPFDAKIFLGNENESIKLTDDKIARALIEKKLVPILSKILNVEPKGEIQAATTKTRALSGLLSKLKK